MSLTESPPQFQVDSALSLKGLEALPKVTILKHFFKQFVFPKYRKDVFVNTSFLRLMPPPDVLNPFSVGPYATVPFLASAYAACTFHLFYNAPDINALVPLQAGRGSLTATLNPKP